MEKYVVRVSIILTTLIFLSGCGNDAGPAVQTEEDFLAEALGAPFEIAVEVVEKVGPINWDWDGTLDGDPDGVDINVAAGPPKTVVATFTDYSDGYTDYIISGVLTMVITNPNAFTVGITLNGTLTFTGGEVSVITFTDIVTESVGGQAPTSATGTVTVDGTVYDANTIIYLFSR